MWVKGQARTIRHSEIPISLIEKFVKYGHSAEAVRRDLVAACFLERKAPDILFVPHKSFLEFLIAEEIALRVRENAAHGTIDVGFEITDEVFSFLGDMLSGEEWEELVLRAVGGDSIMRRWIRWLSRTGRAIPVVVEHWFARDLAALSIKVREELAFFYEGSSTPLSETAVTIIAGLLTDSSEMASVHAYRLAVQKKLVDRTGTRIAPEQLFAWLERKWVNLADVDEEIGICYIRQKLLNIVNQREHAKFSTRKRHPPGPREVVEPLSLRRGPRLVLASTPPNAKLHRRAGKKGRGGR
jgi:hypothetical protein